MCNPLCLICQQHLCYLVHRLMFDKMSELDATDSPLTRDLIEILYFLTSILQPCANSIKKFVELDNAEVPLQSPYIAKLCMVSS